MSRKRKSPIWLASKEDLKELVEKAKTITEILACFGLENKGHNYRTLKKRLQEDGIPYPEEAKQRGRRVCHTHNTTSLDEILVKDSTFSNGKRLKKKLLGAGLVKNICIICGQKPIWNGKPLVLELDHINGNRHDNRLENLRIICAHCHSQTPHFRGKNKRNKSTKPNKEQVEHNIKKTIEYRKKNPVILVEKEARACPICGKDFVVGSNTQKYCSSDCAHFVLRVVERPSKEELTKLIWTKPTLQVAQEFGVSDKAVEKWCKNYGIEKPPRGYWAKRNQSRF